MHRYMDMAELAAVAPKGDFVCVDTETANETRASLCAVGVAVVSDGRVVASAAELIDPRCGFNPFNTAVNGIDERAVVGARTLDEVWGDLVTLCNGQTLVCHNAAFDVSVLRASAAAVGIAGFDAEVSCTMRLARRVWPQCASYGLAYLSRELEIPLDHHEAGSDAEACGWVAVRLLEDAGAANIAELHAQVGMRAGRLSADSFAPISVRSSSTKLGRKDAAPDADTGSALFGKTVCFTGAMVAMERREAAELVTSAGATFVNTMSKNVDLLVVGDADFLSFADGRRTGKLQRAAELREGGQGPEIVREADFLRMLA